MTAHGRLPIVLTVGEDKTTLQGVITCGDCGGEMLLTVREVPALSAAVARTMFDGAKLGGRVTAICGRCRANAALQARHNAQPK